MPGSGLFLPPIYGADNAALMKPGGKRGEIYKLRRDVARALAPMAAIVCHEYTDPVAAGAATLKVAAATVATAVTILPAGLLSAGLTALAACPRNLTFTTAGTTPADAPANVVVTGTDYNGNVQTETITLAQTATIASGVKAFKTITSIVYPAGDGVGGTVSIGIGAVFALPKPIKSRAGAVSLIKEHAAGSVVTTGTLVAIATAGGNGTYAPATAPNGTNDYAIWYEADATLATY